MFRANSHDSYIVEWCNVTLEELVDSIISPEQSPRSQYVRKHLLAKCCHCIRRLTVVRDLLTQLSEPSPLSSGSEEDIQLVVTKALLSHGTPESAVSQRDLTRKILDASDEGLWLDALSLGKLTGMAPEDIYADWQEFRRKCLS